MVDFKLKSADMLIWSSNPGFIHVKLSGFPATTSVICVFKIRPQMLVWHEDMNKNKGPFHLYWRRLLARVLFFFLNGISWYDSR